MYRQSRIGLPGFLRRTRLHFAYSLVWPLQTALPGNGFAVGKTP